MCEAATDQEAKGAFVKVFILILLLTATLSAQRLTGRVFSETLSPIKGARVIAMQGDETWTATTDETGRYLLELPRYGRYAITAVAPNSIFAYRRLRIQRPIITCEDDVCWPASPETVLHLQGRSR